MPKNKQGGKKFKKGKKTRISNDKVNIIYAEEGQTYALVKKKEGGSRLQLECSDGKIRSGIIPGRMRKRVWMNPGDILLVSLGVVASDKSCTIDNKFNPSEVSVLRSQGLISFEETENNDKSGFEFKTDAMDFSDIHGDEELSENPDYNLPSSDEETINLDDI